MKLSEDQRAAIIKRVDCICLEMDTILKSAGMTNEWRALFKELTELGEQLMEDDAESRD